VAGQTKILLLLAGGRLPQLILVVGSMRIVASQTVANRRRMDLSLDLRGVFVAVAREAELVRSGGDQLYARGVFVDPDFMATHAAHRDRGMDGLAFRLVLVAFEAFGSVDVLI